MLEAFQKLWSQAKSNVGFLAVCLAVFAGLFVVALLFEKVFFKQRRALYEIVISCAVVNGQINADIGHIHIADKSVLIAETAFKSVGIVAVRYISVIFLRCFPQL